MNCSKCYAEISHLPNSDFNHGGCCCQKQLGESSGFATNTIVKLAVATGGIIFTAWFIAWILSDAGKPAIVGKKS